MKIAIFIFTLILAGCSSVQPEVTRTQVIMGTFASLTLQKKDATQIDEGFKHLKHLESILSSYEHSAHVYRLNKYKTLSSHDIVSDILQKSIAYHAMTLGYFDITVGSITKNLYKFGEIEVIPTQEAKHNAPMGIDNIQITDKRVDLLNNITIDLGGIGKGYAVDSLSQHYKKLNVNKGKIALSGDIKCLSPCKIAIENPFYKNKPIATLTSRIDNLSISTSGTYRRYIKNKAHHHLINPKRKNQGKSFASVSIIAENNNTLCDVMATAIATMPKKIALDFVRSQNTFAYILITHQAEIFTGNLETFVDFKHHKK